MRNALFRHITHPFVRVFDFYVEGFRNMTWGRTLWLIIVLKLIVLFVILRLFFFKPVLSGMSVEEKQEHVATMLEPAHENAQP